MRAAPSASTSATQLTRGSRAHIHWCRGQAPAWWRRRPRNRRCEGWRRRGPSQRERQLHVGASFVREKVARHADGSSGACEHARAERGRLRTGRRRELVPRRAPSTNPRVGDDAFVVVEDETCPTAGPPRDGPAGIASRRAAEPTENEVLSHFASPPPPSDTAVGAGARRLDTFAAVFDDRAVRCRAATIVSYLAARSPRRAGLWRGSRRRKGECCANGSLGR